MTPGASPSGSALPILPARIVNPRAWSRSNHGQLLHSQGPDASRPVLTGSFLPSDTHFTPDWQEEIRESLMTAPLSSTRRFMTNGADTLLSQPILASVHHTGTNIGSMLSLTITTL